MKRQALRLILGMLVLLAVALQEGPQGAYAAVPPPTPTAPASGASLAVMEVTVAWDLPAGATQYHLQVNPANNDGPAVNLIRNAAGWFTIAAPPTWYVLLPDMTYTWRVRATDKATFAPENDISWSAWSESRTFRTPTLSSAGMQPVSPGNGSTVQGSGPVMLRWSHPSPTAFYYEVQMSGDTRFDANPATATSFVYWNLIHGGVTNPPNAWQSPAVEPGKSYYWRVRPRVQGDGTPVTWSDVYSFQTSGAPGPVPGVGLVVGSHRSFPADIAGFVNVVGEVTNNSSTDVYSPRVTVSFVMADGRPAGTFSAIATRTRLSPGQKAGFRLLEDPQPGWSRYDIAASSSGTANPALRAPVVRNVTTSVDGAGVLHIVGEVVNDTGANLRSVKVAITLYDPQGAVMNVDSGFSAPDELNAGAVATFNITFTKQYQGYLNASILAEGIQK